MVATALILLSTDPPSPVSQKQMVVLVMVIICRELTMSSLREWAASRGKNARKVCEQGFPRRLDLLICFSLLCSFCSWPQACNSYCRTILGAPLLPVLCLIPVCMCCTWSTTHIPVMETAASRL